MNKTISRRKLLIILPFGWLFGKTEPAPTIANKRWEVDMELVQIYLLNEITDDWSPPSDQRLKDLLT